MKKKNIKDLHDINSKDHAKHKHNSENAITISNLHFTYPGAKKGSYQLKKINLNIKKGQWTTILGPNGSGKSTLAKAIVKINKYKSINNKAGENALLTNIKKAFEKDKNESTAGTIKLFGKDIRDYKGKEFAKKIAYIPQYIEIPEGTPVYEFVSYGRNPYVGFTGTFSKNDKKIIEESMKEVDVWEWKDKMMDELSGGQRQKVIIAMIMVQQSDIILLDEPTTYLDIRNQYELLELMDAFHHQGKTIIAILHDINQATQYSDRIVILKDGELYDEGTPDKAINSKSLEEVYRVKAKLFKDGKRKYITDVKLINTKDNK